MKTFFSFMILLICTIHFAYAQNYSLSFNGDVFDNHDYVEVSHDPAFNFGNGNFTVEHWYNSDLTNGHFTNSINKYVADGNNRYWDLSINADDTGFPRFHIANGTGNDLDCIGDIRIDDNTWHHLCGVRDNTNMYLYIDGQLNATLTIPADATGDNSGPINFGAFQSSPETGGTSRTHIIDEVRIWNRALSQSEIQEKMDKKLIPANETGLIGYWGFNEGTGTTTLDASGDNHHGTIIGASWSSEIAPISEFIEEFTFDMTQANYFESSVLEAGVEYYLIVSGTYSYGGNNLVDAAYRLKDAGGIPFTPPIPFVEHDGIFAWDDGDEIFPEGLLNNWEDFSQRPTPNEYSSDHMYIYYFFGDGSTELFQWVDGAGYGDNSGNLSFEIWKNYEDSSLPVELSSFNATAGEKIVELQWMTASEVNNQGFNILRANDKNAVFTEISSYKYNTDLIGAGTSSAQHNYTFQDKQLLNGQTYWYKLVDIDLNGAKNEHGPISATPKVKEDNLQNNLGLPTEFKLYQNYPNPFNPSTQITYSLAQTNYISLKIFDTLGREVQTLVSKYQSAGTYSISFEAANFSNGIYYYRLKAGDEYMATKKMVLML